MKALVIAPAANADLIAVYNYTADRWGLAQADRYLDDLRTRITGE